MLITTPNFQEIVERMDDVAFIDNLLERIVSYYKYLFILPDQNLSHKQRMWKLKYIIFEDQIAGISTEHDAKSLLELYEGIPHKFKD